MSEQGEQHNGEFTTLDFSLACFLSAIGYHLLRLEGRTRGHHSFIFSNVPPDIVTSFYRDAKVSARQLLITVRQLKGKIKSFDFAHNIDEQVGT